MVQPDGILQLVSGDQVLSNVPGPTTLKDLQICGGTILTCVQVPRFLPGYYCKVAVLEPSGRFNKGKPATWEFRGNGTVTFQNGAQHSCRKEGEWQQFGDRLLLKGKIFNMGSREPWTLAGEFTEDITVSDFIQQHGDLMKDGWHPPSFASYLD